MSDGLLQVTEVDYDPFATPELARAVPTTEAQRELWLADQLGSEASLAFNESISLQFAGSLNVQSLQDALLALADRHESLRATFSADGMNMLIAPRGVLQATLVEVATEGLLAQLRLEAVTTPFDLVNGPLVRATLVPLAGQRHDLILTAHHIVCDGWSFGVLVHELTAMVAAFSSGRADAGLASADAFGDYALATQEEEQVRAAEADERYWVSVFKGSAPTLDLPTDRPRRGRRGFASKREDLRIEPPLVEAARRLGAPQGASLFATLFGLFGGLVARLSGDSDIVVGVPAAAQAAHGLESLVGHCVNLLPVRLLADGKQTASALIAHARERVLDAYDHQTCTFGRLLSKLQLPRDAGRLPLVSVQFNLDTAIRSEAISSPGLAVTLRSNPREFENFDLFVNASQVDGAIVLECQYNTDLFDAATVRRWLELYRSSIERAAADPSAAVSMLYRATADDEEQLLSYNATLAAFARDARVESLVAAQVARTPQAVAVISGDTQLTYSELEGRANAVAHALLRCGVGPGQLVGMACGRNEHLLVGMLGILKTGAGYVPLDPAFPADRLAYMQEDAGLGWIVADRSVVGALAPGQVSMLWVDDLTPVDHSPLAQTDAGAPAYVIYTSGSTGKPKGVVVPQRAVVNFLATMSREPGLTASDRLVAVTTSSFDIAVLELFLPLTLGAQVILAGRDTVLDGMALAALIERHQATVMQATPSGWRLLLDGGWAGRPGFKALVGGEGLPEELALQLMERTGELWNMYGPTETTVWSTCWRVQPGRRAISIGTPIANTEVHVLDEQMQACPIGVAGEIYIGGDGVASGYLHRPELTAERFVPHPRRPADRIYRTGDLGRWCNDGLLEHLGRLDFQVKVRGYRIELGEIESALKTHGSVDQVVVVAREDRPGDVRLVGYVVSRGAQAPAEVLRDHLRQSLPEYMVPQHVVQLDRLPLTPNGKIDRKSLPAPDAGETPSRAERVAPRTETEAQVLAAMEEVLSLPGMGIHDDFFVMGGHSLLAARLVSRLGRQFEMNLPLRTLFEAATTEKLARSIDATQGADAAPVQRIKAQADQGSAPLTVMQERIRFMEELHPDRTVYNTPSAHRLKGPMDADAFERAIQAMIARQPSLRTAIERGASGYLQRVQASLTWHLPRQDLRQLADTERHDELMRRMQRIIDQPIDITQAPLFHSALFRLGEEEHVFLFVPHHIVWDGWSFDILYEEMAALYPATLAGSKPALALLEVSYVDFAQWHQQWMGSDEFRRQVQFWKKRFDAVETPAAIPTDRPRQAGMTGTGAVEWVHVDKNLTEQLRAIGRRFDATLNMLTMAVYAGMLRQTVGGSAIVMGIPVRGRLAAEVEPVMGFFNNLLPIHLGLDLDMTLSACVAWVKSQLLDLFANQEVPFERLAQEREIASMAQKSGLYQALFSFQDARDRPRHWGPLRHESVLVMQKGATEDFGLWLMEVPGGLEGGVNYNADLFERQTSELFRDRYVALLGRAAAQPEATLRQLLESAGPDLDRFNAWVSRGRPPVAAGAARQPVARRGKSPAEATLAALWARLLGISAEHIQPDDNFFDLGGSSLLVMQAVAETAKAGGPTVEPGRYVYEDLAKLAAVETATQASAGAGNNTATVQALAAIWADLLGIDAKHIRGEDNFFDLGGSSLLAMRFVNTAEAVLGQAIDAQRLVYESLSQLAVKAAVPSELAAVGVPAAASADTAPASGGLLSKAIRKFGWRT